jgi:hypothetical protein
LGAEDEFQVFFSFVQDPVAELWPDLEALLGFHFDPSFCCLEDRRSLKDKEELAGSLVKMLLFRCVWRHPFHFDGKFCVVYQVPSVTVAAPDIMT